MITGVFESKTLTKHIWCKSKCRFDGKKCNSNQTWNNDKCRCVCKIIHVCEKDYVLNRALYVFAKMENIKRVLWMIQLLFVI